MIRQARKGAFVFLALLLGWGGAVEPARAGGETMYDYTKIPSFLEVGLNPNLLLMIDNSASMYDPAYRNPSGPNYCYVRADEDINGDGAFTAATEDNNGNGVYDKVYDNTVAYAGYFDPAPTQWYLLFGTGLPGYYGYQEFDDRTEAQARAWCGAQVGTKYSNSELCLTIDPAAIPPTPKVRAFAAKGRFLNWLLSSKFDVEKEVLTGGKYDSWMAEKILESRGCDGRSFIKDIAVTSGGSPYVASFGIRPPTEAEKTADSAYFLPGGTTVASNTRLDFYNVSPTGLRFADCADAIEAFAAGNLGAMMTETKACLDPLGAGLVASQTAFNHIMQECWYYNMHGAWQGGGGTVTAMKNDCDKVYKTTPGAIPAAGYVPPETLSGADVCYGQYDPAHPLAGPWGNGYVGQCWEPQYAGGFVWVDRVCNPLVDPTEVAATDPYCNTVDKIWYRCPATFNANKQTCKSGNIVVPWVKQQVQVPLVGGVASVDWTNDNIDGGYACVDAALKKYCGNIDEPTTIDPSDYTDPQGTTWGLPALLLDVASQAQLGKPIYTGFGRVWPNAAPSGLVHEFKYNLRFGAMEFNVGSRGECRPIEQPAGSGRYIASLYDCLLDKGAAINAGSWPDSSQRDGGRIITYIDEGTTHTAKLVRDLNNIQAKAWTPAAEALFNAVGYFTQDNVNNLRLNGTSDFIWDHDAVALGAPAWNNGNFYAAGARVKFTQLAEGETKLYFTNNGGTSHSLTGNIDDDDGVRWTPYDPVLASCQKNHILLITDGASTADYSGAFGRVNSFVATHHDPDMAETWRSGTTEATSYECQGLEGAAVVSTLYGSTLLDDLVYYANQSGASIYQGPYRTIDGEDKQEINFHVVSAGALPVPVNPALECEPKVMLGNAAANSGNVLHEANDAAALKEALRDLFEAIGGEPASGSAASVISNSRSGEGAIYQAVFYPKQIDSFPREIKWAGDVHSLWLDDHGNIREDCGASDCTSQDFKLNPKKDTIVTFYTDPINNSARAKRYSDADGDGRHSEADLLEDNLTLNELHYLWSAGEWLAAASPDQKATYETLTSRYIFTSDDGSTVVPFTPAALAAALGASYPGYFKAGSAAEAGNIVNYVRGYEIWPYRTRLIDWDGDGSTEIWKLGDIVHSTPTVVSQPAEDYDSIYHDVSYQAFRQKYRERRSVIYAGGNDGGLHAFNGGFYDRATHTFLKGPPGKVQYDLGSELWMYVPKNLWPHLKWLTAANYSHVFYVDLKPYIFDAKIFKPDVDHPHGWGTVLVGGMGFGGGNIGVDFDGNGTDDETMRSAYFIMDITNPEAPPRLLAEFTRPDLGFTTVAPTAIPMLRGELGSNEMDWYLAFGSGPHSAGPPNSALAGESDQLAKLFIYPLGGTAAAGGLGYVGTFAPAVRVKSFNPADAATFSASYFSDLIAVDFDLDYKTDSLYFGSVGQANEAEHSLHIGGVHRLHTGENLDPAVAGEELDPDNWVLNTFFAPPGNQPVTASPSVAWDGKRAWIYVGTGNYSSARHDKPVLAQQSYYGLKERYDITDKMRLDLPNGGNLVDVSHVTVANKVGTLSPTPLHTTGSAGPPAIASSALAADTFKELNAEMSEKLAGLDKYHGWKLDFDLPGERNLGQAAILGNIVTFTTFVPSEDTCRPEGNSYLWAPYYRTGTAYYLPVIGNGVKVDVGPGLTKTPTIIDDPFPGPGGGGGDGGGTTAFVQTSTGAIIAIEQDNPGVVGSGMQSWRECETCGN